MALGSPAVRLLVWLYGIINRTGLLDIPWVRRRYNQAYFLYKRWLEDPFYNFVRKHPEVMRSGHVLDLGANIGYTAITFAQGLAPGQKVFAFEPDVTNFNSLSTNIRQWGVEDRIVAMRAAVGAKDGEVEFWHNTKQSADHRVITAEFAEKLDAQAKISRVRLRSVDQFWEESGETLPVALIKIDVQGYELSALEGMTRLLAASPQTLIAFEFAPEAIRDLGQDPESVLTFFRSRGYQLAQLLRSGDCVSVSNDQIWAIIACRGYLDIIASKNEQILRTASAVNE